MVGGWVRDRLIGRSSGDLDLSIEGDVASAGDPARRLAAALGVRAHLLGNGVHRVWRIEAPDVKVELWPLEALDLEADMKRRDFTCNALAWELPDGPLVDAVDGLADLRQRRLRAVSRQNLADDPVRLLRGPRFLAQLDGFALEAATREWTRELAHRLQGAPRERVGQELLALLRSGHPSHGMRHCLDLGLFEPAAPAGVAIDPAWARGNLQALDSLTGAGVPTDSARMAFLLRAWSTPTAGKLSAYSWPRDLRDRALRAARLLDQALATTDAPPADRRELAWRAGSAFEALLLIGEAIHADPGWRRWRRQWRRDTGALQDPKPLLTGEEISDTTGIDPGPELGELVRSMLRAQVRGEIRTRGGARRWLRGRSEWQPQIADADPEPWPWP